MLWSLNEETDMMKEPDLGQGANEEQAVVSRPARQPADSGALYCNLYYTRIFILTESLPI